MSLEIIKYDSSCRWSDKRLYKPVATVIKRKLYKVSSWNELFKILMFTYCFKKDNMALVEADVDNPHNEFDGAILIRKNVEESGLYTKFSPSYYFKVFYKHDLNCKIIKEIIKYSGKKDLEVYIARYNSVDEIDSIKDAQEALAEKLKESRKLKVVSSKHLIAHINGKVLSAREKFYKYIEKEFDRKILIGDIRIDDDGEKHLKSYMMQNIQTVAYSSGHISHPKVFAYGLVRVALKHYSTKTFWPYLRDEYGVNVSGNHQRAINEKFKSIMVNAGKAYDTESPSSIQNICMHAFVCNKCADQFFDYMFDFWRVDLDRSIENIQDDNGNDLFEIMVDEIGDRVQDVMIHTAMALKYNPGGCKIRLRRLLRMIDNSYWHDASYSESKNRIIMLFEEWKKDPNSSYSKDLKKTASRRRGGRGEKLLSRPTIVCNDKMEFKLVLPKQILRYCTEDEHPQWFVNSNGEECSIEPTLMLGKASLYTMETSIPISKDRLFDEYEIILKSEERQYYRRIIAADEIRFFNSRYRGIEIIDDYISKDVARIVVHKDSNIQCLNGAFTDKNTSNSEFDVYSLSPSVGDILILPNDHALSVGKPLVEGIINSHIVGGAYVEFNDSEYCITTKPDKLFFKAPKNKLNGTALKINKHGEQQYFGRVVDNEYCEFRLDESLKDIYGYIIDLKNFLHDDGVYDVEINIPGVSIRLFRLCLLQGFQFYYEGAPFIFKDFGKIVFPRGLKVVTNNDWMTDFDKVILEFPLDEDSKDVNQYMQDRKLRIPYRMEEGNIDLVFDVPVFYWKYGVEEPWSVQRPQDTMSKLLPKNIYVSKDTGISSVRMFVGGTDEWNGTEIPLQYDKNNGVYYFRSVDISAYLSRAHAYKHVFVLVDGKRERFFKVACRSDVRYKELTGDFENGRIMGFFDIFGNSEYMVTVKFGDEIIEEDVPLRDGRFQIDCDVREGAYTINLYELEDDDSGFGAVSYPLGSYKLNVVDIRNLSGRQLYITGIKDIRRRFSDLSLKRSYYITNLQPVSFNLIKDKYYVYTWRYDCSDYKRLRLFYYYQGYLGVLNRSSVFTRIAKVLVVFDDPLNANEVLINTISDDELVGLIYSPDQNILQPDERLLSKYDKRHLKMIDDDLYSINVVVPGGK